MEPNLFAKAGVGGVGPGGRIHKLGHIKQIMPFNTGEMPTKQGVLNQRCARCAGMNFFFTAGMLSGDLQLNRSSAGFGSETVSPGRALKCVHRLLKSVESSSVLPCAHLDQTATHRCPPEGRLRIKVDVLLLDFFELKFHRGVNREHHSFGKTWWGRKIG